MTAEKSGTKLGASVIMFDYDKVNEIYSKLLTKNKKIADENGKFLSAAVAIKTKEAWTGADADKYTQQTVKYNSIANQVNNDFSKFKDELIQQVANYANLENNMKGKFS